MKGDADVLKKLNAVLTNELTSINQYFLHARMYQNEGYGRLGKKTHDESIEEMKHAEKLIARILFLEGIPMVSHLKKMNIGVNVEAQLKHDLEAEAGAIQAYNDGIRLCLEVGDNGTRDLIDANLHDEEEHLDWLEAQLDQIAQMGLQNYLLSQAG